MKGWKVILVIALLTVGVGLWRWNREEAASAGSAAGEVLTVGNSPAAGTASSTPSSPGNAPAASGNLPPAAPLAPPASIPNSPAIQPRPAPQPPAPAVANPQAIPPPTTRNPAEAMPPVTASLIPQNEIEEKVARDLDAVSLMLRDYRSRMGENPVGTNAEIMKAVMGGNPRQARLGPPEGQQLNGDGELVDRWGTPYFFHQLSKTQTEVRSAGPDKQMWNEDDIMVK